MAAYAALLSLDITIERIQKSFPPVKPHTECLTDITSYLLGFLERNSRSSGKGMKDLEGEITDFCNYTEDVIETIEIYRLISKMGTWGDFMATIGMNRMRDGSSPLSFKPEESPGFFFKYLPILMEKFVAVRGMAEQLDSIVDESRRSTTIYPSSPRNINNNNTMVGFEEHLEKVMEKIVCTPSKFQILSITGMGGIGKTTLARNVFDDQLIKDHFEIRLWTTISQSYQTGDIFRNLLSQLGIADKKSGERESDLGIKLYQALFGCRYVVVLDDVWNVEVWESMRKYFPHETNHSRVIITTRELKVASHTGSSSNMTHELEPLGEMKSWDLLKQQIFQKQDCPSMLEDIGRKIALGCKGLPLALAVIGGQLAKANSTRESWQSVADDMNSALKAEGDDDCVKILSSSYENLPIQLKPCFLFMGVFPEDNDIRVSKLVKLWVAEGLLRPAEGECFEDTGMEYLTDLVERNLILVGKRGSRGKMVSCQIHDLIRDVCLREGYKENFLCTKRYYPVQFSGMPPNKDRLPELGRSLPELRRCITRERGDGSILYPSRSFEHLLRLDDLGVMLFAARYRTLTFSKDYNFLSLVEFLNGPNSVPMWQNVQTVILSSSWTNDLVLLPPLIWEMTQLRHLEIERLVLPDPPDDKSKVNEKGSCVLKSLQTLLNAHNLKFRKEVLQRIANVKKLEITYTEAPEGFESLNNYYRIGDLDKLLKLETLSCSISTNIYAGTGHISFPPLLKKLTLDGARIPWDDMTMVGSLPNLEVLRLRNHAFCGAEWTPTDGEFGKLKSLHLHTMSLQQWNVEVSDFPSLESLILCDVWGIEDIPDSFGETETLKLISLEFCSASLGKSAEAVRQEQKDTGNYEIQVRERRTNNARDRVWKLEKHLKDFCKKTRNVSSDLVCEIEDFLEEADSAIKTAVNQKRENNIHLLFILEEVKDLHSRLQAIYPRTDLQAIYPQDEADTKVLNDEEEGPAENNESPIARQEHFVGFEKEETELIEYLMTKTSRYLLHCGRSLHSFVGRPGVGKTTLVKKVFHNPVIEHEYPIRIWCSYVQTKRDICLAILKEFRDDGDYMIYRTDEELVRKVAAHLRTKNFLIVWDGMRSQSNLPNFYEYVPENGKVLITTRFWPTEEFHKLTEDESWSLLQLEVFGRPESLRELKPESAQELKYYGKLIAGCCDGLPLAVVVIGAILAKKVASAKDLAAKITMWKNVAENVSNIQKGSIQSIIALSYNDLSSYRLRACFLYLGMFPDEYAISAWKLIRMWIAEGFVQHKDGLSLEEVAETYLDQLIDRKLLRVDNRRRDGKVKTCSVCHEIRVFCLSEATHEQENFFSVMDGGFENILQSSRRICIFYKDGISFKIRIHHPLVRTLVFMSDREIEPPTEYTALKLLRVLDIKPFKFTKIPSDMFKLIHLSYVAISLNPAILPREFSELWNVQTLIVDTMDRTLKVKADLLKMKKLRHFKTNASAKLPKPESGSTGGGNIQTLGAVSPRSCTQEEFACRARSLKKLGIRGRLIRLFHSKDGSVDFLVKLENLQQLKLANDVFPLPFFEGKLCGLPLPGQFPPKLSSLTLKATFLDWSYMSVLGQLESLKVLKLKDGAFVGKVWETKDGGFRELEVLYINQTDLVIWTASEQHFPRLRSLELKNCEKLIQIPIELADIPSFQMLQLYGTNSAVAAANKIRSRKEDGQTSNTNQFKLSIFAQVCSRIDINTGRVVKKFSNEEEKEEDDSVWIDCLNKYCTNSFLAVMIILFLLLCLALKY